MHWAQLTNFVVILVEVIIFLLETKARCLFSCLFFCAHGQYPPPGNATLVFIPFIFVRIYTSDIAHAFKSREWKKNAKETILHYLIVSNWQRASYFPTRSIKARALCMHTSSTLPFVTRSGHSSARGVTSSGHLLHSGGIYPSARLPFPKTVQATVRSACLHCHLLV